MKKSISDQELLTWVRADIEAADLYYEDEIEPACIKRLDRFTSNKDYYARLFPDLQKRCTLTMSDVADTIYWIIPSLMRIFFGSSDVVTISGRTAEDDATAMQELCNWEIQRKNRGFLRFYKWFMDALILGHGVMKTRWNKQVKKVQESAKMTPEEFIQFDPEAEEMKFISAEENPDGSITVKVRREKLVNDEAAIENVPVSEFRWLPDKSEVQSLLFCYHRRLMTRSEIEANVKAKVFKPVTDEDIAGAQYDYHQDGELDQFYRDNDNQLRDGAAEMDKSRTQYWVFECYGKYDVNGDRLSEDLIITVIGEKIVRMEYNDLERPHFSVLSPYPDQYQITGRGIDDMIGELQDAKVAMFRQIILNVANNNDRQAIVSEKFINADDLRENKKYIRASNPEGMPVSSIVAFMPEAPLASAAFPLLQELDNIKENRTGVTKYNQGGDSKDLNKTATGVTAIMAAANQRIEMIARMFAETGVIDLFQILVEMNQRYMSQEVVIRLTNGKQLQIRPDDLKGEYDLDIAAGVGAGQRQEATQNMMLLINSIYPALNALGVPVTPDKVLEACKTLITQMGYKDASKYLPTIEEVQNQMMMQQQQLMRQAQMEQQQKLDEKSQDLEAKILLETAKGAGKK